MGIGDRLATRVDDEAADWQTAREFDIALVELVGFDLKVGLLAGGVFGGLGGDRYEAVARCRFEALEAVAIGCQLDATFAAGCREGLKVVVGHSHIDIST